MGVLEGKSRIQLLNLKVLWKLLIIVVIDDDDDLIQIQIFISVMRKA